VGNGNTNQLAARNRERSITEPADGMRICANTPKSISMASQQPLLYYLHDTGIFPNSRLPVIFYKSILRLPILAKGRFITRLFRGHDWSNSWDAGVFTYHHYHSTTHEVLGFYKGRTELQLGGESGPKVGVAAGDVLVIPAGVAHRNLGDESQIRCIRAYPDGRKYDIRTGRSEDRPSVDHNIECVPLPEQDPVLGTDLGLCWIWAQARATTDRK
jgi:uncharacterized protein YjlB